MWMTMWKAGGCQFVQGEGEREVQHQGIGSTEETFGNLVSMENGSGRRDVGGGHHARVD